MNTRVRLSIERQAGFAEGFPFGDAGPYERLTGSAFFELDPGDPANANVVDLPLAPRNANGAVEFRADLDILKPVDLARGNGCLLYDVNNRGNKTALRAFNDAPPDNDPLTLAAAGNGFLMRQGYTVVWSAWQGDLVPGDGLLTVDLPEALENGAPVRGRVRQEFIAEQEGVLCMPLSGAPTIRSYPALDLDTAHATMTLREHERDPRGAPPAGCLGLRGGGDGRRRAAGAPLPHRLPRGWRFQTRLDIRVGLRNGRLPRHGARHRGHPRPGVHAAP